MQTSLAKKHDRSKMVLTIAFTVICIVYVLPIVIVLINSFKTNAAVNTDTFALPNEDTFVGWQNYIKGMTFGNYPFIKAVFYSLFITLVSSALILICTSMAAWYVARVGSLFSKIVYYLCVFSMVVPFQMVMFTLSRTAEQVKLPYFSFTSMAFAKIGLNTPWTIPIVYLGFGAGLAVFMFSGFVKTIPLEIEEAAAIDGCGPVRTFFLVVLPMLKPTFISVGAGDHVGVERLSAAVPGAGSEQIPHHPHRHPVSEGQLRTGGYGRHHGADPAEHRPGHHLLSLLPEAHHQGRGGRRRQGLNLQHAGGGLIARPRIFLPGPSG